MKLKLPERRRFVRIKVPLRLIVDVRGNEEEVQTKNISPIGLSFNIKYELDVSERLKLKLFVPIGEHPIALVARVVWQSKVTLEDNSPFDVGVEIIDIDEEDKNIFLKYLCDLLYGSTDNFRT